MAAPNAKSSSTEENDRITYAVSCMKGARDEMQDYHTAILDLDGSDSTSLFAVFDGHGGDKVALYCSKQYHIELVKDPDYQTDLRAAMQHVNSRIDQTLKRSDEWMNSDSPPAPAPAPANGSFLSCLKTVLCCLNQKEEYKGPQKEGSTACVALIKDNQIIVANVGDSRCVLSRNGQAIDLSTDHKPNDPGERKRIEAARGKVVQKDVPNFESGRYVGTKPGIHRVDGIIAVSRAIGDFQFKKNNRMKLTCTPDIRTENITDDIDFLLIASDGIWEVKTSQEVVAFVNQRLQSRTDPLLICERLLDACMASGDNSTVILVLFKRDNNPTAANICSELSCTRPQAKTTETGSTSGGCKDDTKGDAEDEEE